MKMLWFVFECQGHFLKKVMENHEQHAAWEQLIVPLKTSKNNTECFIEIYHTLL